MCISPTLLTSLWRWAERRNLTKEWAVPLIRGSSYILLNDYICWCSTQQQQQCGALGLQLCLADKSLAEHLQDKFSMFFCKWMLPNCTRKMGTGDYLCIAMSGGAPWGFRLQGGKEQKQPLQIAKVGSWEKDVIGVLWTWVKCLFEYILLPVK